MFGLVKINLILGLFCFVLAPIGGFIGSFFVVVAILGLIFICFRSMLRLFSIFMLRFSITH